MALFVDKRIQGAIDVVTEWLEAEGISENTETITETVKHYAKVFPDIKVPQLAAVSICNYGDNVDIDECMALVF
jgi:hypothetical protein